VTFADLSIHPALRGARARLRDADRRQAAVLEPVAAAAI
jgi:hypothetical protein